MRDTLAAPLRLVHAYWRWAEARGTKWGKGLAFGVPVVALLFAVLVVVGSVTGGDETPQEVGGSAQAKATESKKVTNEPKVTNTPRVRVTDTAEPPSPTQTPMPPTPMPPTSTPVPSPTATPKPSAVVLEGVGQAATDPVSPPASICRAIFTHDGSSNFIVKVFQGGSEELLINEIGPYQGQRPIVGEEPVVFDIDADGAWTMRVEPIGAQDAPAFSGIGDAVSGLFSPPSGPSPWSITHTGESNFVV